MLDHCQICFNTTDSAGICRRADSTDVCPDAEHLIKCRCGVSIYRCRAGCTLFGCCGGYASEGHLSDCTVPVVATITGGATQRFAITSDAYDEPAYTDAREIITEIDNPADYPDAYGPDPEAVRAFVLGDAERMTFSDALGALCELVRLGDEPEIEDAPDYDGTNALDESEAAHYA